MEDMVGAGIPDPGFWARQRVLLTGHTGFKGAWLALWLERLGAYTAGLALDPDTTPSLFTLLQPFSRLNSRIGDIRDADVVIQYVKETKPTVAIHMAAQPLVRRSFREPVDTVLTNVMGTVNVLEALRRAPDLAAALVVTTDKVYLNRNTGRPFIEDDPLGGHDPYSASKAAAEMIVSSWSHSYFESVGVPVATARSGNVVGGGDWSEDRLVPDLWRAAKANKIAELRYPEATRPWQHVLDPLNGYLVYIEKLVTKESIVPPALNFAPRNGEKLTVANVADAVFEAFGTKSRWERTIGTHPPEMKLLSLDARLATQTLKWKPRLDGRSALRWTVDWYKAFDAGGDPRKYSLDQIRRFESLP